MTNHQCCSSRGSVHNVYYPGEWGFWFIKCRVGEINPVCLAEMSISVSIRMGRRSKKSEQEQGRQSIFLKESARRGENKRKRKKMGAGWARNICSLKLEISG